VLNDGGAIPRPPFSSEIRLMKFGYCCLERAPQIICRERSIPLNGMSCNPGCHWEGLNFLHSSHCKFSSTRQQYCLALAGRRWFPYLSGGTRCKVLGRHGSGKTKECPSSKHLGQLKDQLRHDSLGCRTEIQATLERSQGIERIIQGLVFFDRVGAGGKEFAGPGNDRFFGVGYSRRNPPLVRLE
jgi:hypothetical protein